MSEQMEKLAEEIASHIETVVTHSNHEMALAAEGAAMLIITRTLQAVADGMPLPGEKGRRAYERDKPTVPIAWADKMMKAGARIWIALRSEEKHGDTEQS